MISPSVKFPFYAKASLIFIGLFALMGMLYIGQHIIVPIIYATILAILINPLVQFFVRKKMGRVFAITLSLALVFVVIIAFFVLLSTQMSIFSDAKPLLFTRFDQTSADIIAWAARNFNVSADLSNIGEFQIYFVAQVGERGQRE